MTPISTARRGVASLLAMLYLVLFSTLALGFYASTTMTTQVSQNEQRTSRGLLAAESGMAFMRYHLHNVVIPPNVAQANILTEVYNDLSDALDGTGNLGQHVVGINAGATHVEVPAGNTNFIPLAQGGAKFRADITRSGRRLIVKVIGAAIDNATSNRDYGAVQIEYDIDEIPTDFFENGMVSRGQVSILTRNPILGVPGDHANIVSLSLVNPPVTIGSVGVAVPGGIAGDITVPLGTTPNVLPGWSVEGSTNTADILTNHTNYVSPTDMPVMPVPDTSPYLPFATNTYVAGQLTYTNIIIPPNVNPTFNGPVNIYGVVYVKQPNKVTFSGQCNITGVIVTENVGVGSLLTNQLIFSGNGGSKLGVEALDPNDSRFAGLRELGGSFIVAPGFDVQLTGNFGNVGGHILGDKVTLSGSSAVTVNGTIVSMRSTLTVGGNTALTVNYDPNQGHAGMRFADRYVPLPDTYEEVKPY